MDISKKVVVITGGAKGLGRAMSKVFVEKGAVVVICDKDEAELTKTAQELKVLGLFLDTTKEEQVSKVAIEIVEKFGHIDIWINNAGVWLPREPLEDSDLVRAKNLFEINVFGTINGLRVALRQMKKQGEGIIINIISTTAFDGMNGSSGAFYVSSKYALRGLTNALRDELENKKIKIIGVYPGGIKTELFNEAQPDNFDQFMSAEDIADKIIKNIELPDPELELVLKRPGQTMGR